MTTKELSQLYRLNREIESDEKRLAEMRGDAYSPKSPNLSGMPSGGGDGSKTERDAVKITYFESLIKAKKARCLDERNVLEEYIYTIPDSLTRQIFEHRYVSGLPWSQVAANIGGGNSADGVRKRAYRYKKLSSLSESVEIAKQNVESEQHRAFVELGVMITDGGGRDRDNVFILRDVERALAMIKDKSCKRDISFRIFGE